MRLQLIAAALVGVGAPATVARAQPADRPTTTVGVRAYADDDHVTVWSPSASAATPVRDDLTLTAAVTVDAVSAASIDVVSAASPYAFSETRIEGGVGATLALPSYRWLTARATMSDERDFTAIRVGAGWRAELARRNTTAEATYTLGLDTVGRAGDPTFARDRHEHRLVLALTQITDRRGYADLVFEGSDQRGYLANPYRFVPVELDGAPTYHVAERVPTQRLAIAALVRVRRAVGARTFAHVDYRLARDSWGVTSHTGSARAIRALRDDRLRLGLEVRGYGQRAATFFQARYHDQGGPPTWRSRDHVLGAMASVTAAFIVEAELPWHELAVTGSAALVRFWWRDDPRQDHRDAVLTSLALAVPL